MSGPKAWWETDPVPDLDPPEGLALAGEEDAAYWADVKNDAEREG